VQLVQQAAKTCMQIAPKVVFFITPIDVMGLRIDLIRYFKNDPQKEAYGFCQKVVDTIVATCETLPITFLNLYEALPDSRYFPDVGYAHLSYEGRKFLVEQLVAALNENEP
jgi:hypothetical protein